MDIFLKNWYLYAVTIIILCLTTFYIYLTWNFDYWRKKRVHFLKPLPLFGNLLDVFKFKYQLGSFFADIYKGGIGNSVIGIWVLRRPGLVVRDKNVIKSVLVREFKSFCDRSTFADTENDPLGSNMLFVIKNPGWKMLRVKLSPFFTSSKMKMMFGLVNKVGIDMIEYISTELKNDKDVVFEARELCAKFTTDSIANVAFGVEANSFSDPDAIFRRIGRKIFDFHWMRAIELTSLFLAHDVAKFFKFKIFSAGASDAMRNIFWKVVNDREQNPIQRHDLIDILINLKNEKDHGNYTLDGDKLVSQAAIFFAAGFETTSNTMAFTLYELAINTQIQEKLFNEIVAVLKKHNQEITYDCIQEMEYLEMCIKETLRMYPPLPFLDRMCINKYTIPESNITIDPGTFIYLPVLGLHMDPDHFPEPKIYNPERFSPENIKNIPPFSYLPFGEGPRNCIGERLGLMQAKIGLVNIVKSYELSKCKTTPSNIVFNPKSVIISSIDGLDLIFKPRAY